MNPFNVLSWWEWLLCGIGSLVLSRFVGWIAEDYGSTPAELIKWIAVFAGVICIAIGIAQRFF